MNSGRILTDMHSMDRGEYSKRHYLPRLKRIIVLAFTNSVTHSRKVSKNFQFELLISANVSTVLGMRSKLAAQFMHETLLTVYTKMAVLQTNFEGFIKNWQS